jgi:hypothetical protein
MRTGRAETRSGLPHLPGGNVASRIAGTRVRSPLGTVQVSRPLAGVIGGLPQPDPGGKVCGSAVSDQLDGVLDCVYGGLQMRNHL